MRHTTPRPRLRITHYLTALLLALGVLAALPATAHAADKDCGDFNTQAAAQDFFINAGGPNSDPHRLDSDGDGVACESNPCPCSTDQGGGGGGGTPPAPQPDPEPKTVITKARVIRVIDGDTIQVRVPKTGNKPKVRLIGIDTPEVYGGVECGGKAASRAAKRKLPKGTRVRLVSDSSQDLKDRYGRLLRYVMKGNRDINRSQVWEGHARVYVYGGDPFKRVQSYRTAQKKAKKAERGLWGNCKK